MSVYLTYLPELETFGAMLMPTLGRPMRAVNEEARDGRPRNWQALQTMKHDDSMSVHVTKNELPRADSSV